MRMFEEPIIEVMNLNMEDIVTTSTTEMQFDPPCLPM